MKRWWIRPAVRLVAATLLPVLVPLVITGFIWALPGDPASLICPPEVCSGTEELARRWNLDGGPWNFFSAWLSGAVQGDFGRSWRLLQGAPVADLLWASLPLTAALVSVAFVLVLVGALGAATRWLPDWADGPLEAVGLVPVLVLALSVAATVTMSFGARAFEAEAVVVKVVLGALALGLADAALSGTVIGVRSQVEDERRQRYVRMAALRGEGELQNALPNVLPALVGQLRARTLHLLSGAVVVEVVLQLEGLGDLLWGGTLVQDFGVVLAAAFGFSLLSAVLLAGQALIEILVALHVRRSPAVGAV